MFKSNKVYPEHIGPCNIGEKGPKGCPGIENHDNDLFKISYKTSYDTTNILNEINNIGNIQHIKEPLFIKNVAIFDEKGPAGPIGYKEKLN